MMLKRPPSALAALIVLCAVHAGYAADKEKVYTLAAVISTVLDRHPDLLISNIDTAITATAAERLAGQLDPTVNASVGVNEDQTPPSSDFQPEETRSGQLSGNISKPFAGGGTLTAAVDFNRTKQDFSSPLAAQLATINPAYRSSVSLSYRMPLMRGSGRPDYTEALKASTADTEASRLQREVIIRNLSLEAVNDYFRLQADAISVQLAEVTRKRADRLLDYQQFREKYGLIESADRKQAEALLATRKLELQQAKAQQINDKVALNRLMLRAPDAALEIMTNDRFRHSELSDLEDSIKQAEANRPEFHILDAQLRAAESRLRIARNNRKMKLDLIAEVGTLGLDDNAGDVANDAFSTADHFAGLSLELGDTLGHNATNADLRETALARQRILAQRNQLIEQIQDEVATISSTLATGEATLQLARQQVEAEKQKFEAELKRYREGRSDTATVVQFEGELHAAELQAELQQLSLLLANRQYAWSRGVLLEEMGIQMPANQEVLP